MTSNKSVTGEEPGSQQEVVRRCYAAEGDNDMRKMALTLLLLPLLLGCTTTSTDRSRTEEKILKEVAAAEAAYNQAMLAGDAASLEILLDDTFIRTFHDGSRQTRAEAIAEVRSGALRFSRLETSEVTINVYGDAAVVRGTSLRQRTAVPGAEADAAPFQLFYTMTLVKRGEAWRIVALHASH